MQKESEGFLYILSQLQVFPKQERKVTCYGRVNIENLVEFNEKGSDVGLYFCGKVRSFSKEVIFRDEIMPEIEQDSYDEFIDRNIGDYTDTHRIRVMEIARAN